ncbi:Bifunctional pantoate ligase/cytidylate kinase [Bradyrhizobium ivorense]|nr:Bifunctional pantoate ligase/cytidylate kinase [Bradyrhizobium ivorense]
MRCIFVNSTQFGSNEDLSSDLREHDVGKLIAIARQHLDTIDRLQYLELVDHGTLKPAGTPLRRPAALCAAGYIGSTWLMDNLTLMRRETIARFKIQR